MDNICNSEEYSNEINILLKNLELNNLDELLQKLEDDSLENIEWLELNKCFDKLIKIIFKSIDKYKLTNIIKEADSEPLNNIFIRMLIIKLKSTIKVREELSFLANISCEERQRNFNEVFKNHILNVEKSENKLGFTTFILLKYIKIINTSINYIINERFAEKTFLDEIQFLTDITDEDARCLWKLINDNKTELYYRNLINNSEIVSSFLQGLKLEENQSFQENFIENTLIKIAKTLLEEGVSKEIISKCLNIPISELQPNL